FDSRYATVNCPLSTVNCYMTLPTAGVRSVWCVAPAPLRYGSGSETRDLLAKIRLAIIFVSAGR
ncbi:hypothetical protein, partial [Microcoleus sp. herbarium12]|uniref:hypothetical protein n=1 Tax=Microcoleus sp. herbarium12 TaxID=3055437 RepID=UPI002FD13491